LVQSGAAVRVHARKSDQAVSVANAMGAQAGPWPPEPGSWDVLVNTTPLGMHPNVEASPMNAGALTGRVVYDLIYNPPVTRLLHDGSRAGLQTVGGLDMLVAQAEEQFRYWTGDRPPAGVMRTAAEQRLAEFATDEAHLV
jgi:shikimate 5-dehydrogenase